MKLSDKNRVPFLYHEQESWYCVAFDMMSDEQYFKRKEWCITHTNDLWSVNLFDYSFRFISQLDAVLFKLVMS